MGMIPREKSPSELVAEALALIPPAPLEGAAYLEARGVTGTRRDGRHSPVAVYLAARLERPIGSVHVHAYTVELVDTVRVMRAGVAAYEERSALEVKAPPHIVELGALIWRGGFEELEGPPVAGSVGPLSTMRPPTPRLGIRPR